MEWGQIVSSMGRGGREREGGEEALVFVFCFFAMRSLQSHSSSKWVVGAVLLQC